MDGNASVHQVYPVSRITVERRADSFSRRGGLRLNRRERGKGGGGGGATQSVDKNNKSFNGTNLTVVEEMHQLVKCIL